MSEFYNSLNKYAFQWDAYRPLVDRIPAGTVQRGGLPKGVSAQGVSAQGVSAPGMSAWGCLPGGACPGGMGVSQHAMGQTPL